MRHFIPIVGLICSCVFSFNLLGVDNTESLKEKGAEIVLIQVDDQKKIKSTVFLSLDTDRTKEEIIKEIHHWVKEDSFVLKEKPEYCLFIRFFSTSIEYQPNADNAYKNIRNHTLLTGFSSASVKDELNSFFSSLSD